MDKNVVIVKVTFPDNNSAKLKFKNNNLRRHEIYVIITTKCIFLKLDQKKRDILFTWYWVYNLKKGINRIFFKKTNVNSRKKICKWNVFQMERNGLFLMKKLEWASTKMCSSNWYRIMNWISKVEEAYKEIWNLTSIFKNWVCACVVLKKRVAYLFFKFLAAPRSTWDQWPVGS